MRKPLATRCACVSLCGILALVPTLMPGPTEPNKASASESGTSKTVDFHRDIRPILAQHCFTCHGPDAAKRRGNLRLDRPEDVFAVRESGMAAVVAGDPSHGLLIDRISTSDAKRLMPPPFSGQKLSQREIDLLRTWVEQGAVWKPLWAFVKPTVPDVPNVRKADWPRNAIDAFVLARLEREGLEPAPEADRVTLLRRLSFDLTGLPPTLQEIDAFLNDRSSDAYERQVDRLLASPHYGERMALYWLDLARYADTHGYFVDSNRDMWRWRDWVIDAFNRNLPFDQFTIEQLAGDLLPNATREQRIASGFNRNGMINFEVGADPAEYAVKYVVDRVNTTSSVWLGLTMACAECHDHKFDPITARDYYQMFALFNNVPERGLDGEKGNAAPFIDTPTPEQQRQRTELEAELARVEAVLARIAGDAGPAQTVWERDRPRQPTRVPKGLLVHLPLDETQGPDLADASEHGRQAKTDGDVTFEPGRHGNAARFDGRKSSIVLDGAGDFDRDTPFTFSAWVLAPGAEGTFLGRFNSARVGYALGLFEGHMYLEISRSEQEGIRVLTKMQLPKNSWHHVAVCYDGSNSAAGTTIYLDGKPQELNVERDNLTQSIRRKEPVRLGLRGNEAPFAGMLDEVRLFERALSADEVESLVQLQPVDLYLEVPVERRPPYQVEQIRNHFLQVHYPPYRERFAEYSEIRERHKSLVASIPTTMVMVEGPKRPSYVLKRGNYRAQGEKVGPGVPASLPPLPDDAPHNRLGLAQWLIEPDHPLTARVAVNRFWQWFFGEGIVETTGDFGSRGQLPSHPELLDWLATDFQANNWDIKAMHKQIVMSATYRQSSRVAPAQRERDPRNRLLGRAPRRRLQAELIRDNALAVAGLLNPTIGGKSFFPYQPAGLWEEVSFGQNYSSQIYQQSKGEDLYRRGMYIYWKRSRLHPTLTTFDAPSRENCALDRPTTTTPLQVLVTLNDPTFVEAARGLAQRILREGGATTEDRCRFVFRAATARSPDARELTTLLKFAEHRLTDSARSDQDALLQIGESPVPKGIDRRELAAWTVIAQVVLNLEETMTRD